MDWSGNGWNGKAQEWTDPSDDLENNDGSNNNAIIVNNN